MFKLVSLFTLTIGFISCNNHTDGSIVLQTRIDSLEKELAQTYKPGFGEFMSNIQVHHAKLWFAGQHQNWKLADFEINEMKEALSGIKTYCNDRPETKEIESIEPSMDSISNVIRQQNSAQFRSSYISLTSACNKCHQVTNHEFNVIKIPDTPPLSNQDFDLQKQK